MMTARSGTQLIEKTFHVLRRVSARHHVGWTLSELARACGYPHGTVHRILAALGREGMVTRRYGSGLYILGPLAQEFGLAIHPEIDLRAMAMEGLVRIARQTGGTSFLNLRSGYDSVCAARIDGRPPIRALAIEPGTRRPLCLSAGGVAILLQLPVREGAAALRYGLAEAAKVGRSRVREVQSMVRRSKREGNGINADNIIPGITAIGVPVLDIRGSTIAALSVAGYSSQLDGQARSQAIAILQREAQIMEKSLKKSSAIRATIVDTV